MIAQHTSISGLQFIKELNLPDTSNVVSHWLGRLADVGLIISKGKTKGKEYLVNPEFLKNQTLRAKQILSELKTIDWKN